MVFTIPDEYGYVLLAATSTCVVSWYHSGLTIKWRGLSGIKYPATYASDDLAAKDKNAAAFNSAQRAHANFTENHASYLGLLLIAGLKQPVLAASLGAGWTLSRIGYAYGYATNGPPGRHPYFSISSIIAVVTGALAAYGSYSLAFGA